MAASAQHMSAGLINLQKRQAFIEDVQANAMSAGQPIFQNAFVQQNAFLSVHNRENVIFMTPPTPPEPEPTVYSTGGQPPAPGAPGAGAAIVSTRLAIPAFLTEPSPIYIGTPRKPKKHKTNRTRKRTSKFKKNN